MHSFVQLLTLVICAGAPLASAHGMITFAAGDAGGNGIGLGVTSAKSNSENDVTVFNSGFGKTGGSGNIDPETDLAAEEAVAGDTLPQVTTGGVLTMTYHQINADGAGPITCSVSSDGTANSFTAMTVTTNVPGTNGKSNAADEDFPLVAQMPAGLTCTGTIGSAQNACVVKCENPVGPFGSNVVIQTAGSSSATANSTSADTTGTTSTTTATNPVTTGTNSTATDTTGTTGTNSTSTDSTDHHHHHHGIKRALRFARNLDISGSI